jgi:TetR/AcrR family transcriptional repressor of nem operon
MGSVRVPAIGGPKASMIPDTICRDSHRLHARSGGKTALICRNVVLLTRAAERDRRDPRVGTDSVMRMSQPKMVTFVNGNVWRVAGAGIITDRSSVIGAMPRPSNPEVRKRLLAAGLELIHARGFAASGVKDITEAAGVPKGSFYAYFQSKEAFAASVLDAYWVDIETRLVPILRGDGSAQERITGFFHALADDHEAANFLLGCLIGNLSLELSSSSEPIRAQLISVLERWGSALAECLRSGDLREDLDPDDVASRLIEAWEGAALRGKMIRSRIPYDRFEADTIPALLR